MFLMFLRCIFEDDLLYTDLPTLVSREISDSGEELCVLTILFLATNECIIIFLNSVKELCQKSAFKLLAYN